MEPPVNEKEITQLKFYTELTEEDVALLKEVQPLVVAHLDELIEAFFIHLLKFEETKNLLKDAGTVDRLKEAQERYLTSLFSGNYDLDYVENRMRIGEVHHKIGLGIKWYIGAVRRYEWLLMELFRRYTNLDADRLFRVERAINGILYFDTQWVLEAYELSYTRESKEKLETLQARGRQQAAVARLGHRALAGDELSSLTQEAVVLTAETLGVEYCKVLELLPEGNALLLSTGVGWKEGLVGHATVGTERGSQVGYTLLSDVPVIVEDLRTETRFNGPPLLFDHGVVSGMSVIIRGKKKPFGVMGIHTAKRRAFTQDDVNFLQAVANVLGMAVENSHVEEALRNSMEEIQTVHQAWKSIEECIIITDLKRKIIKANPVCVRMTGYTQQELVGQSPKVFSSEKTTPYLFDEIGDALIKRGLWSGKVVNRKKDGALWDCQLSIKLFRDLMGIPKGYVAILRDITEEKRWVELLERQVKDIEALRSRLKAQFEDTIYMFAIACEAKDEVTGNHVRRIREYSTAIAKEIGLPEEWAEEIGISSVLHDVGKIHIPDSILKKPAPLTAEEFEVMKTHALAGGNILNSEHFNIARKIALYHHENWDGSGYPIGLKGADIPIEARIVRVADVFDALTTKRPYKPIFSETEALKKIRAMKGKELSPMKVEALERAYQKGIISEIKRKYS